MNADAGQSHQAEQQEARRNGVAGKLCGHQSGKVERDLGVELALAIPALLKRCRQLDRAQVTAVRCQNVEKDLEPLRVNRRRQRFENVAPDHEVAAHWVSYVNPEKAPYQRIRPAAQPGAALRETGGGATA